MSQTSQLGAALGFPLGGKVSVSGGLTVSVSDSIALSDSVVLALYPQNATISVSDSITLSDAAAIAPTGYGLTDAIALSDSVAVSLVGASSTYSIVIDHTQVCATLTNYPLRFGVTDGSYPWLATVINGGSVQDPNGYDITFTSDFAGLIPIPFERVYWDPVTGNCKFYILVASVSSSLDTVVYAHAGANIHTDQQNPPAVWTPSGHVLVQHYPDGTSLSLADSTQLNTITNHGASPNSGYDSLGAVSLSGSSQYVDCGNASGLDITSDLTLEAWVNCTSGAGSNIAILSNANAAVTNGYQLFINASDSRQEPTIQVWSGGANSQQVSGYHGAVGAGWLYLAGRVHANVSNSCILFVNGAWQGTDNTAGLCHVGSSSSPLTVGAGNGLIDFPGDIGEVRISSTYRSDCWLAAVWANLKSGSTFYSTTNIPTSAIVSQYAVEVPYGVPDVLGVVSQYAVEVGYGQKVSGIVSQYVLEACYLYPAPPKWQLTEA